ncbi:hypothetical protein GH733_015337 [Mirounga leonina]|nr:hypothetical protein GH733_015337 [Mirounga leonina]
MNDGTVGIFRGNQMRLKRACIRKAKISAVAFRKAFCHHKLVELDATGVNADITITDIISGLGSNKWIQQNLQCLVLNSLTLSLEDPYERCFSRLSGLRALSITNVLFYNEDLAEVASLPRLESLDISNTSITDITALLACKDRLKSLTMHHLKCLKMTTTQILDVVRELKHLNHLDISDDKQFTSDIALRLLEQKDILPNLVSLDVSGRKHVTDKAVEAFIQQRPSMQFVGLLATDAGYSEFLTGEGHLKVSGEANETQIAEALKRYSERAFFVREALFHLFSLTHVMEKTKPEILKECLSDSWLIYGTFSQSPAVTGSFKMFHSTGKFEAAKLVMQWLCNHEDQNMQRMAVAIISILAAKLSTEQTAQLGAELFIVRQLLQIVKQKTNQNSVDTTLKFTLSALWNLTDESPTTCRHFIENQGLELFMRVLESFPTESSIQQKVLGLLNNIAEVQELHSELMWKDFIDHISSLLHSVEVEVSYFAAGIIAHLISRGEQAWTLSRSQRNSLLDDLHSAILKWPTPECEMVAYRSFNPFFPLLGCFTTPGVQLWAVWAMQHVCSKNRTYCSMLIEEGGLQHLYNIKEHEQTDPHVQQIAVAILDSLEKHIVRHGRPPPCKKQPQARLN